MVTKRTPIRRFTQTEITPEAIAIYKQMRRIQCECGPYPPGKGPHRKECRGCTEWWRKHSELDTALGPERPWYWPRISCPTKYPDADGILRRHPPRDYQRDLEERLKAAARELTEREKETTTDVDPIGRGQPEDFAEPGHPADPRTT